MMDADSPLPPIIGLVGVAVVLFVFIFVLCVKSASGMDRKRCKKCLWSWLSCEDVGIGDLICPRCGEKT